MAKMSTETKPGAKGESFNWSRNVMNKFLRRSFLDGVMALYETASEVRVHSVELRGSLTLTINKAEEFTIRLNESAQRMAEDNEYTSEPEDSEIRDKRGWELGCESPSCSKRMKKEVKEEVKPMPASIRDLESASPSSSAHSGPTRSPSPLDKVTTSESAQGKGPSNLTEDDSCGSANVICSSKPSRSRSWSRSTDMSHHRTGDDEEEDDKDKSCSSSSRTANRSESAERDTATQRHLSADWESPPRPSADCSVMAKDYSRSRNRDPESLEKLHTSRPSDNTSTNYIYIDDDEDEDKVKSEPVDRASPTVPASRPHAQAGHSGATTARLSQDGMLRGTVDMVFTCVLCNELFQGQEVLGMHMEYHRHAFAQFCHTCSSGKLPLDASIRHMVTAHGPASVAERQQSLMMPTTSITTAPSQSSLSSPGLQCEECGKRFSSVQELLLHLPSHVEVHCDLCQESFPSNEALDNHRRSQHGALLPATEAPGLETVLPADLFCSACQASFPSLQLFQDHLLQYHTPTEGSFACSLCRKPFKQWTALRQHLAVEHDALHCCTLCQEAFVSELHLLDHHLMQHSLAPTLASGPDAEYETGQVFRCEICFKTFPSLKHCSIHKQSHGLSKPFACSTCGSSFLKKGDLTKHIRTVHSTHRPFLCVLCGKTGTRMDNMRSHVRIHKKSMPREELESYITDLRKPPLGDGDI